MIRMKKKPSKFRSKVKLSHLLSCIVVAFVFIWQNLPLLTSSISQFLNPKLSLHFVPSQSNIKSESLDYYLKQCIGVPNCEADVYIFVENHEVEIGETISIHIEIFTTKGWMKKPYFYVLLINNTGHVCAIFPQEVYLTTSDKLPNWFMYNNYIQLSEAGQTYSIPRETLIKGRGTLWINNVQAPNREIWIEKEIANDPHQIGTWSVYIILLAEKYYGPDGKEIPSRNAVTYTTDSFYVGPKTPRKNEALLYWWRWITSTLTLIFSAVTMFKWVSPWIDKYSNTILTWIKRNKIPLIFTTAILLLNIVLWFLK